MKVRNGNYVVGFGNVKKRFLILTTKNSKKYLIWKVSLKVSKSWVAIIEIAVFMYKPSS